MKSTQARISPTSVSPTSAEPPHPASPSDTFKVTPIPAFDDNYIWCLHNDTHAYVVDPGDAAKVTEFCHAKSLTLAGILVTHHHWDHTGGIDALLATSPDIPVFGSTNPNISQIKQRLVEGDKITLDELGLTLEVLEVPGHTLDHIAYFAAADNNTSTLLSDILFCGDTLFSGGCGRLFEGTPAQMQQSLCKLSALPVNTLVYCTHEYTLANLQFARAAEPQNSALQQYQAWAQQQRAANLPTLPSNIEQELAINPFLRTSSTELQHNLKEKFALYSDDSESVFAHLRRWKDNF